MKILIDMNMSPKFVDLFAKKGVSAVHWIKVGSPSAKDTEIMEYANKNNYIVMTGDLDFNALMSISHGQKPSVILLRVQQINTEQDGERIVSVIIKNKEELLNGAILSMSAKKYRVRLLPI